MPLRSIICGIGSISRRGYYEEKHSCRKGRSCIAPEQTSSSSPLVEEQLSRWANMPQELLHDIIQRVEASEATWPARRDVVACALVCRSWRELAKQVVKTPEQCGLLTFPISLKQPGPRDSPIQCFIKRERATSTYLLYLGLSPALSGDESKLLLAARKVRRAASTEFAISFDGKDFSRSSCAFVGKLRSNFLGTKFSIYDSQPPIDLAVQSNCMMYRRIRSEPVSPIKAPVGNYYNVANIAYELNVLRTRGPRRMQCTLNAIPISSIQEGGTAPTPTDLTKCQDEPLNPASVSKRKTSPTKMSSISSFFEAHESQGTKDLLILKNKSPRWHENLQCWCLNFKGRVTVASVKNFQLVAAAEPSQNISATEQEKVILQFGKMGKDIFSMDYRYPLSAFQAFAICLSSFDTKPACE